MYIYADVVFMINMIMNSVILLLTAWTAGLNYKWWRILAAAAAGSGYVLFSLLPDLMILHHFLVKMFVSFFLIGVAFGLRSKRTMLLLMAFFYIIAFVLGGAVVGWLYLWQTSYVVGIVNNPLEKLSWTQLLWGSCMGIFLVLMTLRRMIARMTCNSNLYTVQFEYEGRSVKLTGKLDTGNGLYTIVRRTPVILVNHYAIEPILSEQVADFLRNNHPTVWLVNLDQCTDLAWLSRIQMIPYHGIGSKSMLLAFRLDGLTISSRAGCIDVSDAVVGIYGGTLTEDGAYAVLLHPQIMNGLSKKEGASICA